MKLIVGLGNPGARYQGSRHNLGADAVLRAAQRLKLELTHSTHSAHWGRIRDGAEEAILALPQTFMNCSGQAVAELSHYYKIQAEEILVVSDDLNLPLGRLRLRRGGSAGGHNGLKSVIEQIGGEFHRLRIGIGEPGAAEQVDFVLGRFRPEERDAAQAASDRAAEAVECWLRQGLDAAMRKYNG